MLSSSYYSVWFILCLLRCGVFRRLIITLYLCVSDSDKKNGFDQLKISDYDRQYAEELESSIF